MGFRDLTAKDIKITIHNMTSDTLVIVSARLLPGASRDIPLRHVLDNYQRALELSDLANKGKIQVMLNGAAYDYTNVGPLTPEYLATLASPSAAAYSSQASGITADRPLNASVPVGFMYFDTTLDKPVYNTSVATWVDGAGVLS